MENSLAVDGLQGRSLQAQVEAEEIFKMLAQLVKT